MPYFKEVWTRIDMDQDSSFFDVIEPYEEVVEKLNRGVDFVEFNCVAGYKVSIRPRAVVAIYESGEDIIKDVWTFAKQLRDARASVLGWEE